MAWSLVESVVLVVWVLVLLGLVVGVFTGVLCPGVGRVKAVRAGDAKEHLGRRLVGVVRRWSRCVIA